MSPINYDPRIKQVVCEHNAREVVSRVRVQRNFATQRNARFAFIVACTFVCVACVAHVVMCVVCAS